MEMEMLEFNFPLTLPEGTAVKVVKVLDMNDLRPTKFNRKVVGVKGHVYGHRSRNGKRWTRVGFDDREGGVYDFLNQELVAE
jgi:hypothetical protein